MTDPSADSYDKDPGTPLLRTQAICKSYRVRRAGRNHEHFVLEDLSFEIRHGEVLALVGESGSGKSTIAKILARMERPSSGYFEFRGERIDVSRRVSKRYRADLQMIFQDPFASLNPIHRIHYHLARPLLRTGDFSRPKRIGRTCSSSSRASRPFTGSELCTTLSP